MERADDDSIWLYAKKHDFVIVTQDSDFNERSVILGYPPKVIWLKYGNTSTAQILELLRRSYSQIVSFGLEIETGCLELL